MGAVSKHFDTALLGARTYECVPNQIFKGLCCDPTGSSAIRFFCGTLLEFSVHKIAHKSSGFVNRLVNKRPIKPSVHKIAHKSSRFVNRLVNRIFCHRILQMVLILNFAFLIPSGRAWIVLRQPQNTIYSNPACNRKGCLISK